MFSSQRLRAVTLIAAGLAIVGVTDAYAGATPHAGLVTPQGTAALDPTLPQSVINASFGADNHWTPGNAIYGVTSVNNLPVTMSDGTVLRVNVSYPSTATGAIAAGKFPVILTQTPYGKGTGATAKPGSAQSPSSGSATGGSDNYLIERGFIDVVADVRGTGDSEGSWGLFDPVQTSDGITLVHWAAKLAHSNGNVGTYGPSYLGINQMLLAGSIGKNSPLKAIFPMVSATDIYRDTSFMGGLIDQEFDEAYVGLTAGLNTANPVVDAASSPPTTSAELKTLATVTADHARGLKTYDATQVADILSGGAQDFDGSYWDAREPGSLLSNIVANNIPAYLVGGEFDIFQRGEPMNYAGLQNAADGRPTDAPMVAGQKLSGRYQLIDGPWEHLNGSSVDVDELELAWFDQFLKGEQTGITQTTTPLHYYDLGTGAWSETTTYPFTGATPTKLYLGDKSLSTVEPIAGTNTLAFTGAGVACSRPVDQWSMGALSIPSAAVGVAAPCADGNSPSQTPVTSASYTTSALKHAERIAGPMTLSLYASANTTNTEWVVEVEEIAPNGTSYPLTEGALLGSLRAVDTAKSWTAPGGGYLIAYHPYTSGSQEAVVPGKVTRYDIEIFPTYATIPAGDSLRITVSTSDEPHLTASIPELKNLAGGIYTVEHSPRYPSFLDVPLEMGQ